MPIKILMPALSPTMTEGNLVKWLKKEGDKISAGEVIAEIETDKATMEVEAVDEGILAKIMVLAGTENVPVNSLLALILEEGEDKSTLDNFKITPSQDKKEEGEDKTHAIPNNHHSIPDSGTKTHNISQRIFASPLAKRIAVNSNILLSEISGSGPHGRIVKADLANIKSTNNLRRNPEEYRLVPNNNIRKIIARRLVESKQTIPHFYLTIECNMDKLLSSRADINEAAGEGKSKKLSVNDFIILSTAKALTDVPEANSSWDDAAIRYYNNVDISVAVAIDSGLITPVIRNANQKDIFKLSQEMKELATKAKANTLIPEEFQGGGFTISNLGMYGIKSFSAIINPPQGAILAVGASSKRAIVENDQIKIATIMDVTLSCDHRVIDGAVGAKFLAAFKKYIESPILLFC